MFRYVQKVKDSIRFLSKSERRKIYYTFVGVAGLTTAGSYAAFHTALKDQMVSNLQIYRSQIPLTVSKLAVQLLEDTLKDFPYIDSKQIGLFNFIGSDIYSIGTLTLPSGGSIGLPFSFNFQNVEQINLNDIRLLSRYRTKETLESPIVQNFLNSLVLSPEAKKYAIAHDIHHLSSSYLYVKTFNIISFTTLSLLAMSNIRLRLSKHNRFIQLAAGALCFVSIALIGFVFDELIDQTYDIRALKQTLTAADNKEEYAKAAIEYYEKLIKRNQALFSLLKDFGPRFYTEDGEVKHWLSGFLNKSYQNNLYLAKIYCEDRNNPKN